MNKHTIKYNALQAERAAVQLDVCISALSSEIRRIERKTEEKGELDYASMFLGGIEDILQNQIDHLFQIKHDLFLELKEEDRK